MGQFFVGRQPIFNHSLEVFGYELLFRDPSAAPSDPNSMTAEVLVHAGLDMGLGNLVGTRRAFVNVTRAFISGDLPMTLPPEQTVIEVLEDVAHDEEVLAGCRRLVDQGYLLALDDYVWAEHDEPLLELAHIVKLDVLAFGREQLEAHVERCRPFDVCLLAEKVETREQLKECEALGFELLQGYLLSRPSIESGRRLSPSQLTCLQLIKRLCDPDVSADELVSIVETDPSLSYRLLLGAPIAAAGGIQRPLTSIREGVVLLGTVRLRNWVTLMLLADADEGASEQLSIALTRARMAQLIAEWAAPVHSDSAYTVGLLSALDLLLQVPINAVIDKLAISQSLIDALLEHSGELGQILDDVLAWELGGIGLEGRPITHLAALEANYVEALTWSTGVCQMLDSTPMGLP